MPVDTPDFRRLFEAAPGLYLVLTSALRIVGVSDAYLKATMTRREEILGRELFEVFPDNPADPAATGTNNLRHSLENVLRTRAADTMAVQKYDIRKPEQEGGGFEERYWSPMNSPVLGTDGRIAYIIHRVEDVTEFVRLKQTGAMQSRITDELRLRQGQMEAEIFQRAAEIQGANRKLQAAHDELAALYAKTKELEHLKGQELFLTFMNSSPVMATMKDVEGRYVFLSEPFKRVFTRAKEGGTDADLFPPDVVEKIRANDRAVLAKDRPSEFRESVPQEDGLHEYLSFKSPYRDVGGRCFVACVSVDMTSQKKLEEHLRQSQKMEAVGHLAGGIAHDFNNILTAILGYGAIIAERHRGDAALEKDLVEIQKAASRGANLTRQLLAFSRKQVLLPRMIDLNTLVSDLGGMLRRLNGESIELKLILREGLGLVKADPGQIEQIIMNLAINARDAMPGGGTVTIETANVTLDEAYASGKPMVVPGPYVQLGVTDTGIGMDAGTRARLFEPFFTTKDRGKGTGLGLSTVYGIVKQSGGNVWCDSELGRGTSFKVYLPRSEGDLDRGSPGASSPEVSAGTECILLVEDEPALLNLARMVLESKGYKVVQACDGAAALDVCGSFKGRFDLLLTDVIMPRMGGVELSERLRRLYGGIKTLYMSGYTDGAISSQGVQAQGTAFLQKPFMPRDLLRKVREVLDAGRTG